MYSSCLLLNHQASPTHMRLPWPPAAAVDAAAAQPQLPDHTHPLLYIQVTLQVPAPSN